MAERTQNVLSCKSTSALTYTLNREMILLNGNNHWNKGNRNDCSIVHNVMLSQNGWTLNSPYSRKCFDFTIIKSFDEVWWCTYYYFTISYLELGADLLQLLHRCISILIGRNCSILRFALCSPTQMWKNCVKKWERQRARSPVTCILMYFISV